MVKATKNKVSKEFFIVFDLRVVSKDTKKFVQTEQTYYLTPSPTSRKSGQAFPYLAFAKLQRSKEGEGSPGAQAGGLL
jgi:hypothetical protein